MEIGILGLIDVASYLGFSEYVKEDYGQSLAVSGVLNDILISNFAPRMFELVNSLEPQKIGSPFLLE